MKRICIVIPYFGPFPNYFGLWLKSCTDNPTIDWLIFTDQDISSYPVPKNVHFRFCSLSDLKKRFSEKLGFTVSLATPYKLCDFKPTYGEMFSEELKEYDFWGYGDMDLIYGDIRKFVTEELMDAYDRLFAGGHLSLFRNDPRINAVYRNKVENCSYYRDVYTSDRSWTFDEFGQGPGAFYHICQNSQVRIFNKKLYADIRFYYKRLQCDYGGPKEIREKEYSKKKVYFEYRGGELRQHWKGDGGEGKEVLYIHLQKRHMRVCCDITDSFYIYPHEFTDQKKSHFSTFGYSSDYLKFIIKRIPAKLRKQ